MDIKQLVGDKIDNDLLKFHANQSNIWTAIPGAVVEWFPSTQTATIQPMVQLIRFIPDTANVYTDKVVNETIAVLYDVLVQYPSSGNCSMTYPLAKGDEGLIICCCKNIDAWWAQGSLANGELNPSPQAFMNMHDINDATFIPGIKSVPSVIPNISTTELQIKSNDGHAVIGLNPTNHNIHVDTTTNVTVNAAHLTINNDTTINGKLHATDTIKSDVDCISDTISGKTHDHGGVTSGASNTLVPNP